MKSSASIPGFHPVRRDQLRLEREHDAYKSPHKPAEPAFCPECGAVFHKGRWQWGERQAQANEVICPACQRIRDYFPAGFVFIHGAFFAAHREEILNLIQHHAEKAETEHPQERLMAVQEGVGDEDLLVTTTGIHLARDLGDALHRAYHGELEFHYNAADNLLRVHWRRE